MWGGVVAVVVLASCVVTVTGIASLIGIKLNAMSAVTLITAPGILVLLLDAYVLIYPLIS